jgi:hypothetical protein
MEHVSAAAAAAAAAAVVQEGLHMVSEIKGAAFTSCQGPRTISLLIRDRCKALCSIVVWEVVGHCVKRREGS